MRRILFVMMVLCAIGAMAFAQEASYPKLSGSVAVTGAGELDR